MQNTCDNQFTCKVIKLSEYAFIMILGVKLIFPADMYGYHGKRIMDFLRITMAMPRLIAPAKRLLEQGFKFGPFPTQGYQSYEANIDFEIRCVFIFALYKNVKVIQ